MAKVNFLEGQKEREIKYDIIALPFQARATVHRRWFPLVSYGDDRFSCYLLMTGSTATYDSGRFGLKMSKLTYM